MFNIGADMVTAPLHNFNMDLKPAFPEAFGCIQYLNICLYKARSQNYEI